ncbi:MAG: hypothetical protein V3U13_11750 [Gemmatimonadota bacterium]|jgi:hypothetical protein
MELRDRCFGVGTRLTLTVWRAAFGLAAGRDFTIPAVVLTERERGGATCFTFALEATCVALGLLRRFDLFAFCADTGAAAASSSTTASTVARVREVVLNMVEPPSCCAVAVAKPDSPLV